MTNIPIVSASEEIPISEQTSDKVAKHKVGEQFLSIMKKFDVPGGQICISKNNRIIYSGCYGYADSDLKKPVVADNLFRIASISKVLTTVAIWQLIEQEKLSLDDKAFDILSDLKPRDGAIVDPRLKTITIRQLLEHTAGFGHAKGDPQFIYQRAGADAFKEPRPSSPTAIIRMAMGDPLEYDPGTKTIYSNLGFNILGRVIERISGQNYDVFVRQNLLEPSGVMDMQLGHARVKEQLPKEVWYWAGQGQNDAWSLLDDESMMVPGPYGSDFAIECFDAHGGWLASATDLVRFASAVEGHPIDQDAPPLLTNRILRRMLAPSNFAVDNSGSYRGEGVVVNPVARFWTHTGGMGGTSAFLYSFKGDIVVAGVFNRLPLPNAGEYYHQLDSAAKSVAHELR